MTARVIMLGLDGMDWFLVKQWSQEGRLPFFHSLLADSRILFFGEPNRPLPGSIWTDIGTGVSAAVHGFVHEEQLRPGSYATEAVNASRVAAAPFYKTLSDAGLRCAVVDFPVDYPIEGFNGVQVVDWGSEFKLWKFETRPQEFARQLVAKYGQHPLNDYPGTKIDVPSLIALKHKLKQGIEIKRRVAQDLIENREHDFIFVNFAELHKGGHFFWKFHDRTHADFTDKEPQLENALLELYTDMDRALGKLLPHIQKNDEFILLTDRGMYADYRGDHLLDKMLLKLGLAALRGNPPQAAETQSFRKRVLGHPAILKLYRFAARHLISPKIREALLPFHRKMIGEAPPFDWLRTRVFRLPNVGNSYLRINLAGREPQGTVAPGAEYEALLAEIAARLKDLVNVETGQAAVEDVYFPGKRFKGPKSQDLPDIAVVWNSRAPIRKVHSAATGLLEGEDILHRTGNHRPEGFALFHGPGCAAGAEIHQGDARQIAPAVLKLFDLPIPQHYEMPPPDFVGHREPAQSTPLSAAAHPSEQAYSNSA